MWNLPRPGIEPPSPALLGEFLSTEPPRKSPHLLYNYACVENPRDGVAWWAAIYGVAQSWTRLKRLSSSSSSV